MGRCFRWEDSYAPRIYLEAQVLPKSLLCHLYGLILFSTVKVRVLLVLACRKETEHEEVLCPRAKRVTLHFRVMTQAEERGIEFHVEVFRIDKNNHGLVEVEWRRGVSSEICAV